MTDRRTLLERWVGWAPYFRSILRVVSAFLFMQYGSTKLFGFPAEVMPGGGTAPPLSLAGIAAILELFGGALLFVGFFTRPVAFILSGEMAIAYFYGHAAQGPWPVLNQGVPATFFCFLFLYFSSAGGGPWSIDGILRHRRTGRHS